MRTNYRNKFHAISAVYDGQTYDSKYEAHVAGELDLMVKAGELLCWFRQVAVRLGEDFKTRVDFLCLPTNIETYPYFVEAKGMETPEFKRVRKLWAKYAKLDLHIMKKGQPVEIINGAK